MTGAAESIQRALPGRKAPGTPVSGTKRTMVSLSLAVAMLMPLSQAAQAQLAVNCTQALRFDTIAACGAGGTLKVTAKSGKVSDIGCVIPLGTAKRGVCTVKSFATSGSIQIKVSAKTATVGGPGVMPVKQFNIGTASGGPTKTYTDAALTATPFTFGLGGNLIAAGGQTIGNYTGQVVMTVTFTP